MTDSAKHLKDATAAMLEVKSGRHLDDWHDIWMSSDQYAAMSDDDVRELELMYQRKADRYWGVLA